MVKDLFSCEPCGAHGVNRRAVEPQEEKHCSQAHRKEYDCSYDINKVVSFTLFDWLIYVICTMYIFTLETKGF